MMIWFLACLQYYPLQVWLVGLCVPQASKIKPSIRTGYLRLSTPDSSRVNYIGLDRLEIELYFLRSLLWQLVRVAEASGRIMSVPKATPRSTTNCSTVYVGRAWKVRLGRVPKALASSDRNICRNHASDDTKAMA